MAGKTEYEAFENYARPIEAALNCVTQHKLDYRFRSRFHAPQVLTFDSVDAVALRRRGLPPLYLDFTQRFRLVEDPDDPHGRFRAATAEYLYSISNHRNAEILSFHWHPDAPLSPRPEPHLHVKIKVAAGSDPSLSELFPQLHIPTGQITIMSVVRMLIEQFGVEPVRSNWNEVLNELN